MKTPTENETPAHPSDPAAKGCAASPCSAVSDTPVTDALIDALIYIRSDGDDRVQKMASVTMKLKSENNALKTSMRKILLIAGHGMPMPSHSGPCGPWAQCDGECEAHANCAKCMNEALNLIEPNK